MEAVMASSSPEDPAAAWRDLVTQWEKNLNEMANRTMGSDEFSQAMNRALSLSAGMQGSLQEAMGRYFASLNVPTRTEMEGIGERLRRIEERLDRVLVALGPAGAAAGSGSAQRHKPPRTKRPPGAGETQ
jgi:Poly(R)-hydroxyalkanoic acid synthase subunit (PHA_synth_III_E)